MKLEKNKTNTKFIIHFNIFFFTKSFYAVWINCTMVTSGQPHTKSHIKLAVSHD